MRAEKQFLFGSILISLAASAMAASIFQYNLAGTMLGILGFPLGYNVLRADKFSLKNVYFSKREYLYFFGMFIGASIAAKGLVIAAQATRTLELAPMVYSGVIMMIGLSLTHEIYVRGFLK